MKQKRGKSKMKKCCISFLIILILVLSAIGLTTDKGYHTEYLRIHVRANSNIDSDQNVKHEVKDAVVELLTPYLATCDTKQKAENTILGLKQEIEKVAKRVLDKNGFTYGASAEVKTEKFPTRVYNQLTLEEGYYDALILNLGEAKGDNWWCVVYPPLCFTGGNNNFVYRSKIMEVITDFLSKHKGEK